MLDTIALTLAIPKSKGHHPNQSNMLFSQKKKKKKNRSGTLKAVPLCCVVQRVIMNPTTINNLRAVQGLVEPNALTSVNQTRLAGN